jgi:hypothetical protein
MISKEDWELRERQWAAFHRWEAAQPPDPHPPAASIENIGMILDWMPEDVRMFDPDPEKTGIRRMQEILGLLARGR